jgi:hypothetical protein
MQLRECEMKLLYSLSPVLCLAVSTVLLSPLPLLASIPMPLGSTSATDLKQLTLHTAWPTALSSQANSSESTESAESTEDTRLCIPTTPSGVDALGSRCSAELELDPEPDPELDLAPEIIEDSPVLQRWRKEVPDVLREIRRDPSFRTRLRLGYSQFPANEQAAGFNLGVEDAFLGQTGLTVSGNYQRTFNGERESYGGDLHYYVLPLGSSVNVAPVLGYRHIATDRYTTDGVNVGARIRLVPSRTGAADVTFTQSWVAPGSSEEVGISTLSLGYAVTPNIRIATDLEKQNAPRRKDSRVAIVLEWMLH